MTRLARARAALPMTFLVYVVEAVLATFVALPLGLALAPIVDAPARPRAAAAGLLLERALDVVPALRFALLELSLIAVTLLALSPWLHMAWLECLVARVGPLTAIARVPRLGARAALVSLLVLLAAAVAALPLGGLVYAVERALAEQVDARLRALALTAASLPLLPLGYLAHVVHDLARARARSDAPARSVRGALRDAVRARVFFLALALSLLGLGSALLAQLVCSLLPAGALFGALAVAVLQAGLLGRLFARSVWLACTLSEIAPGGAEEQR